MQKKLFIIFLIFYNCTGWPALQHTLETTLSGKSDNRLVIIGILLASRSESGNVPTTVDSSTPTSPSPTPLPVSTSAKNMTSFNIVAPAAMGTISGTNITVTVPGATNLTSLIASFTHTGVSVKIGATTQTSGSTSNNLQYSVVYTVYAQDGSFQDYTVNVIATSCTAAAFCYVLTYGPSIPPGGGANFGSYVGASGDGISGIDAQCNVGAAIAGLPASNYRAMIMTSGGTTIRNQNTNWVLKPNKQYRRQNGITVIGVTNASSVFPIATGNLTNSFLGSFANIFSGINVVTDTSWSPHPNNCDNWTSGALIGAQGANPNNTSITSIDAGVIHNCTNTFGVYCVEQ
jgi:hypothetical protein